MSSETERLFKDNITKKANSALAKNLLDAICEGEGAVKNLLFGDSELELYSAHGAYQEGMHNHCEGLKTHRVTEKRICKCLYYRNGQYYDPNECHKCMYKHRLKIVGSYQIADYEVPAYYYGAGIGEIDLIISDGKTKFATEVKPYKGNSESLLRMIAEIMTYTMGYPEGQYHKAIAFFEGTSQAEEFFKVDANIKKILEKANITVFCFRKVNERTYEICRLKFSADQTKSAVT